MILLQLLQYFQIFVLVRVMMTWIMPGPQEMWVKKVFYPVDLFLKPFRTIIPFGGMLFDVGPVLALLFLHVFALVLSHFV